MHGCAIITMFVIFWAENVMFKLWYRIGLTAARRKGFKGNAAGIYRYTESNVGPVFVYGYRLFL